MSFIVIDLLIQGNKSMKKEQVVKKNTKSFHTLLLLF